MNNKTGSMCSQEEAFIEFLARSLGSFGLKESVVRIVARLYLEPAGIPMDELAAKAGYSLGAVSSAITAIEPLGILQKTRKPGERKAYYFVDKDLAALNIRKLKVAITSFIHPAKDLLPGLISDFRKSAQSSEAKERLKIIAGYLAQVTAMEQVMEGWIRDLEAMRKKA